MGLDPANKLASSAVSLASLGQKFDEKSLAWVSGPVAVYTAEDPFWEELAKSGNSLNSTLIFLMANVQRLPVAAYIQSRDKKALVAFLEELREKVTEYENEPVTWKTREYQKQPYLEMHADGLRYLGNLSIYFAATDNGLLLTLSEPLLKRALDRQEARAAGVDKGGSSRPETWLGSHVGFEISRSAGETIRKLLEGFQDKGNEMQRKAWNNIPILNEWKRLYPQQDPLKLHERIWHARLIDPAGGEYRWNDHWQTYESSNYGHPGEPKDGPSALLSVHDLARVRLGLTFEDECFRARAELLRAK